MLNVNNAVKTVSFMMFATLAAKILGMVRDILLASYYGTGSEAVAFLTASRIPLLFFDIGLGAAIASTFIPVFNQYLQNDGKEKAIEFSNHFVNIVLLITGVLTLLGIIFARQFVNLVAPGLDDNTYLLTVELTKILFPMIIFTGLAFSFVGILQSFNEFNIPASISLVSNIIIIVYFVLFNKVFGIYGLAVAMLIGWSVQVIVQIPALIKKGYSYRPKISFMNEGIRKVSILALPVLVSTWVQPINAMVNIRLASWLNEGQAVAALDYANKLYIIIVGVFTYALTNLIFPSLSRMSASDKREEFSKLLNTALRSVVYFITPMMVGFIILRVPLIELIYKRGAFDNSSTELTSTALLFYSIGMLGFAIHEIMNKGFYAMHDAKTPMKIAAGGITLNILLSVFFVRYLNAGIGGLALAASIASITISSMLLFVMNKKVYGFINNKTGLYFLQIVFSAVIMGIIVYITYGILGSFLGNTLFQRAILLLVPAAIGALTYLGVTVLLKVEETQKGINMLKVRLKNR